jgi:hypothetical protein
VSPSAGVPGIGGSVTYAECMIKMARLGTREGLLVALGIVTILTVFAQGVYSAWTGQHRSIFAAIRVGTSSRVAPRLSARVVGVVLAIVALRLLILFGQKIIQLAH